MICPTVESLTEKWLRAEIKRVDDQFNFALAAGQHEIAESYHEKLVRLRFLLKQEQEEWLDGSQ